MTPDTSHAASRPALAPAGRWWRAYLPARTRIDSRERLRICTGALLGVFLASAGCHLAGSAWAAQLPWLIAPLGASAVLVFGVPNGPMSQPWPVIGGNTISALVGIAGVQGMHLLGRPELAAGVAVATAVGVMLALRCLHPPGGATALMVVLGGVQDPLFAFYPVMLNAILLVAVGVAYHRATGRTYPPQAAEARSESDAERSLDADLDAVLARHNQVVDVSREELKALLAATQMRAYQRKLAEVRCADIMSRELVTVEFGTPLQEAWSLLRSRRIKALPVVDRTFRIAGIVTLADFLRGADLDVHDGFDGKLRQLIRTTRRITSSKPEVVGQIMTRQVRVASMDRRLVELLPLFGSTGHHHIPIIGEGERLVGMITQSDLVAALGRAVDPTA
jgi:CBS domain-containing membrane protein